MKIIIPDFLKQNNILTTIDTLSYTKYINHNPLVKNAVQINSNALIYVTKGSKILHLPNCDRTIKAGDLLFIKSGNYVMSEVLDECYEALLFFYSDELLNDFINKYKIKLDDIKSVKDDIFIFSTDDFLQKGLLSIIPYFENKKQDSNIVRLKLEEIFLNILNSDDSFRSFLKLIYSDEIGFKNELEMVYDQFDTIKELSKHFRMSELNFRAKFKELYNTTPKKWIISQKLKKAKLLIEQSDKNVSEVCMEVGFDNISWFIQSFKKEFGSTPKKQKLTKIK